MTKIDFGFELADYADNVEETIQLGSEFLNGGYLGLMLGSGASQALSLPSWSDLVTFMANDPITDHRYCNPKDDYTTAELKEITAKIKRKIGKEEDYIELVKKHLYDGVLFDFNTANKELLIALSALCTGTTRGTVQDIITYNFDSILEWYFFTVGHSINIFTKSDMFAKPADVNITHIHGYLPHDESFGETSSEIIFTEQEFEDRLLSENDIWKDTLYEFFRRHVFLTIGLSTSSLLKDIIPFLRQVSKWYHKESVNRGMPYGISIVPLSTTADVVDELRENGIIAIKVAKEAVPETLFKMAQTASLDRK
jgi:hypothetical protein